MDDAGAGGRGPNLLRRYVGVAFGSGIVYGQLAVGAAALMLGLFPVGAALGIVQTEGGIEPIGRLVALLFGGIFVAVGIVVGGMPFMAAARRHGAVTRAETLALGRRALAARMDARSIAGAGGVALLAVAYWLAVAGVGLPLLGDATELRAVVVIEFLVIHGFPFLVITASFGRRATGVGQLLGAVALVLLSALYVAFAWLAGGGIWGVAALLYLMAPNVIAFLRPGVQGRVNLVSRWVLKFILFMLTASSVGEGSFDGPGALMVGAVYFTLLAAVELFRLDDVPGDLAGVRGIEG